MNFAQYLRLVMRESRRAGGRMALFVACIAIGVAAVVVVAGVSTGVTQGVRSEGRRLMAADVSVQGRRPLPPELDAIAKEFSPDIQRADLIEFVSIVLGKDNRSQLAEVKVVDSSYPFYGQLTLEPEAKLMDLLTAESVVVAPELLPRLGLAVGDELELGGSRYRIAGVVTQEPDKLSISFTLGPRVFLSYEGLQRTALLGKGSRAEYRALFKLPDQATASDATGLKDAIEARLPDAEHYRARMFTEAQPALRRGFDRIGRYLGLVGLLSLLIGGVGVAQVSRVWLASRLDDIAILRCLGVKPRQVVTLFLLQVAALACIASVIGSMVGTLLLWLLPKLAGDALPVELLSPWQPLAVLRGLSLGMVIAMLFSLPLLLGLRQVPPVRVLRRDTEPVPTPWLTHGLAWGLLLAGIWTAAAVQGESAINAWYFVGGLSAVVIFLALAAAGVSRLARLLPQDAGGLHLRHGLSHLARPGAATIGAMVALGLGVSFLFATHLVERDLSQQLHAELPEDAPSTFFIDVQPDQWLELEQLLRDQGATGTSAQPIVTARFAAVDGVPISQLLGSDQGVSQAQLDNREDRENPGRSRRWALAREQRITYGPELAKGNRVIRGNFAQTAFPPGKGGVSVEESFASDIGVDIGSIITLDVQGVPVELVVTSIRSVDWRTFGINFFLFAEPGPLDEAPQMRVAVARLPRENVDAIQTSVVRTFPNVTLIHIRDVMEKVMAILEQLALAVRGLGLFTLIAGMIVLGGAIVAAQARRAREVALFKTIGMTRRDVLLVFAIEYALTGLVAAIIGVGAGTLLAWAVLAQVMDLPWGWPVLRMTAAVVITVALAVIVGLAASLPALRARPIGVLRTQ